MGTRRYSVDTHPKKKQIIRDLTKGELTFRKIAAKYNLTLSSIYRYMKHALIPRAAEIKAQEEDTGKALLEEVRNIMAKAYKMLDACDAYLEDPDNLGKYFLGARAEETKITYRDPFEKDDGKTGWITKKVELQKFVDETFKGKNVTNIHINHADPRKLLLDATKQLYSAVELSAKIYGNIKDENIVMVNSPVFQQLQQILLDSIGEFPELRRVVASGLLKLGKKEVE